MYVAGLIKSTRDLSRCSPAVARTAVLAAIKQQGSQPLFHRDEYVRQGLISHGLAHDPADTQYVYHYRWSCATGMELRKLNKNPPAEQYPDDGAGLDPRVFRNQPPVRDVYYAGHVADEGIRILKAISDQYVTYSCQHNADPLPKDGDYKSLYAALQYYMPHDITINERTSMAQRLLGIFNCEFAGTPPLRSVGTVYRCHNVMLSGAAVIAVKNSYVGHLDNCVVNEVDCCLVKYMAFTNVQHLRRCAVAAMDRCLVGGTMTSVYKFVKNGEQSLVINEGGVHASVCIPV